MKDRTPTPNNTLRAKADLLHSSLLGDDGVAHAALERGWDPSTLDREGRTMLFDAVIHDHRELAALLLEHPSINASHRDRHGSTPLHYAALHTREWAVQSLLDRGAEVNAIDAQGNTALWHAVFAYDDGEDGATIKALLKAGADPDIVNLHGKTIRKVAESFDNCDARRFFKRSE